MNGHLVNATAGQCNKNSKKYANLSSLYRWNLHLDFRIGISSYCIMSSSWMTAELSSAIQNRSQLIYTQALIIYFCWLSGHQFNVAIISYMSRRKCNCAQTGTWSWKDLYMTPVWLSINCLIPAAWTINSLTIPYEYNVLHSNVLSRPFYNSLRHQD